MSIPQAEKILQGEVRAASRLMRDLDDGLPGAIDVLRELLPHTGRARILGITGPPGAGKSTLTDRLIAAYRAQGKTVGVIAIDPTSPFSGGAILGDRIRMQDHATDPGVFVRSLATRGSLGGLSRATAQCVRVMDAMGKEVVIVETVGVGQDELDIAQLAHTTVVVVVPGMGDDVQALKAGILEIADVFVVNKADHEGADRTGRDLRGMLQLRGEAAREAWLPPIVKSVAVRDEGTAQIIEAVASHHRWLEQTGELALRERARARAEFLALLRERLMKGALEALAHLGSLDDIADRIAHHSQDPYALVEALTRNLAPSALEPQELT